MIAKRGSMTEEQLFFLADVVFLSVVAIALLSYLGSLQADTTFEKNYVSRELATLVTLLQTISGDARMEYKLPILLNIELAPNEIIVTDKSIGSASHQFSKILDVIPSKVSMVDKIILSKTGNLVKIE